MQYFSFIIDNDNKGQRLDVYVCEQIDDLSRSFVNNLISKELITVNKTIKKAGYTIKDGDIINVTVPDAVELSTDAEDIPIDIVYEDDYIAVINKAKGMVVHPALGSPNGTLVNALLYHLKSLSSINGVIRPGIVHRLDKDTSGLIVIAKNDEAHLSLSAQISSKEATKVYRAIVDGIVKKDSGSIIAPISRSPKDRKKMAVVSTGKFAHTDYRVLERFNNKTYMEFILRTGRTHQIRVHSKHIGHPVTGDSVYGGDTSLNNDGQLLHAYKLELNHPQSGEKLSFIAPLPSTFEKVLNAIKESF